MDFTLSDAEQAAADLARQVLTGLVTDVSLRKLELEGEWLHRAAWTALADAGLLGVAIPEAEGGSGLGLFALCELLRQVGRTTSPLPVLPSLVAGALPLARFGSEAQRRAYLPAVAQGRTRLSAGIEQLGSRDPLQPAVLAQREGDGWALDGCCLQVQDLPAVTRVLVPARHADGVLLCLVDPAARGLSVECSTATCGEPLYAMRLSGVRVEPGEVIAEGARASEALEYAVQVTSLGLSALTLGVAERALRMTASYVGERQQFGRPIGSFQAVAQRAADAFIDVSGIKVSLWQAAFRLQHGLPAAREVAIARLCAIEGAHRVVMAAQHLHGGIGFDRDYPLHRSLLWAKRLEQGVGGASLQLQRLGALLAQGARGDGARQVSD